MSDNSWFAGNHGPEGAWSSLKGSMLAPHIAQPMTSTSSGDSRHQTDAMAGKWTDKVIVNTGMTRGGGTMAK